MALLARVLVLAVFLTAGSWLGLGRPGLEHVRARACAPEAQTMAPKVMRTSAETLPPSPTESDPSLVGSPFALPAQNPEASVARAWMVAEGPRREPGNGRRLVTLTFDDGPTPDTTPKVLRLLKRHHVKATFFVIGRYLDGETGRARMARETLRKVVSAGHLVGNHSYDHVRLPRVSQVEAISQIDRSALAIERTIGQRPSLFRPPYGALDAFGERAAAERGLELVLWSVEKGDMKRDDAYAVYRDLLGQLDYKEGGIVLLHDVRPSSVAVLERLLRYLDEHAWDPAHPARTGYQVVDLPTYLKAVAAAPLPFANRDDLEEARRLASKASLRTASSGAVSRALSRALSRQ